MCSVHAHNSREDQTDITIFDDLSRECEIFDLVHSKHLEKVSPQVKLQFGKIIPFCESVTKPA